MDKMNRLQSINPYTEQVVEGFDLLTGAEIGRHVDLSRTALQGWRKVPVTERVKLLGAMSDHLRSERGKYASLITREMGKPIREAVGEIEKCAWLCDYFAGNAEQFLAPEEIRTEAKKSCVMFEPLGIVLAIMPWNFPFWQAFRFAIPAICAGNVVLLKHASNVPATALAIEKTFKAAGFPDHVFKTLLIDAQAALHLINSDQVDAISLTGSGKAGEEVGALAGRRIKKLVLELGGSDPFIVLDDADIERAARTAVSARMLNAGQSCIAAKRFIVMEGVANEFTKHFIARLKELKIGNPKDETTDIGPLAKEDIRTDLQEQLADARKQGGEIFQLEHTFAQGFFFAPAVVCNTRETMRILREEVFGPIAPIIVVKNEEEAIRIANDTVYGLGASIWSKDLVRAERVAAEIQAGCIAINDMVKSDPRLPFGGVKKSGIGRELSHYGLKEFVNIKTVVIRD